MILSLKHRSGRKNIDAVFSCCPEPEKEKVILPDVIKVLSFSLGVGSYPLLMRVASSDKECEWFSYSKFIQIDIYSYLPSLGDSLLLL